MNEFLLISKSLPEHLNKFEQEQYSYIDQIEELQNRLNSFNIKNNNLNDTNETDESQLQCINQNKNSLKNDSVKNLNDQYLYLHENPLGLCRYAAVNQHYEKNNHLLTSPNRSIKHLKYEKTSPAHLTKHKFDYGTELYNRKKLNTLV